MMKERFVLLGVAGVSALATAGWMRQGQTAPVPVVVSSYQPISRAVFGPATEPTPAIDSTLAPAADTSSPAPAPATSGVRVAPQVRMRSAGVEAARQRDQIAVEQEVASNGPTRQRNEESANHPQASGPVAAPPAEAQREERRPEVSRGDEASRTPQASRRDEPTQTAARRAPIVYDDRGVSGAPAVKERSRRTSAAIIAGGAAAGAAIGAIAGRGRGAIIGAVSGAGAGLIYDQITRRKGISAGPAGNGTLGTSGILNDDFYGGEGRFPGRSYDRIARNR